MRRWRHPTSRDLWVAARPTPSEPLGYGPRSHRDWAFFKITHPLCTGYHPNYFLLGFRATPSIQAVDESQNFVVSTSAGETLGADEQASREPPVQGVLRGRVGFRRGLQEPCKEFLEA